MIKNKKNNIVDIPKTLTIPNFYYIIYDIILVAFNVFITLYYLTG